MNGNSFTRFYKYPNPKYVIKNVNENDRVQKSSGGGGTPPTRRRLVEGEDAPVVDGSDPVASKDETTGKDSQDAGNEAKTPNEVTKKDADKDVVKLVDPEPSFSPKYSTEMTTSRPEYDKDFGQCKASSETDFILGFENVLDGTNRQ